MLDKYSVYNVLAEGMYFLEKSISFNFNFVTACLKFSKLLMWFVEPGAIFFINLAPFCNILAQT